MSPRRASKVPAGATAGPHFGKVAGTTEFTAHSLVEAQALFDLIARAYEDHINVESWLPGVPFWANVKAVYVIRWEMNVDGFSTGVYTYNFRVEVEADE